MSASPDQPNDFEAALASVDPAIAADLRALVSDSAYVDPRVVSHLRD